MCGNGLPSSALAVITVWWYLCDTWLVSQFEEHCVRFSDKTRGRAVLGNLSCEHTSQPTSSALGFHWQQTYGKLGCGLSLRQKLPGIIHFGTHWGDIAACNTYLPFLGTQKKKDKNEWYKPYVSNMILDRTVSTSLSVPTVIRLYKSALIFPRLPGLE